MEEQELYKQAVSAVPKVFGWVSGYATWETALQFAWLIISFILARMVSRYIRAAFKREVASSDDKKTSRWFLRPIVLLRRAIYPTAMIVLLFLFLVVSELFQLSNGLVEVFISLIMAWLVISFVTSFIESRRGYRVATTILWVVAAMHILDVWQSSMAFLDGFQYSFGAKTISLLGFLRGILFISFFMWAANVLSRTSDRYIRHLDDLSPSVRVLLGKLSKIALFAIAPIMAMNAMGLDLTTLTVFSGAAGLGLGFGLQKVFSNYISGIILLLDKSIKPGDVVAIDATGTYGWVKSLGARYVSLITRDGKEHLIPNELLITEKVENWSHSDNNVRIHINVGISYDSDLDKALELIAEAVDEEPRIIKPPQPSILVMGFGESSVDLEARCWIKDPVNGVHPVKSAVFKRIWHKFKENNIKIPYPQQDLHVQSVNDLVLKKLVSMQKKSG